MFSHSNNQKGCTTLQKLHFKRDRKCTKSVQKTLFESVGKNGVQKMLCENEGKYFPILQKTLYEEASF